MEEGLIFREYRVALNFMTRHVYLNRLRSLDEVERGVLFRYHGFNLEHYMKLWPDEFPPRLPVAVDANTHG